MAYFLMSSPRHSFMLPHGKPLRSRVTGFFIPLPLLCRGWRRSCPRRAKVLSLQSLSSPLSSISSSALHKQDIDVTVNSDERHPRHCHSKDSIHSSSTLQTYSESSIFKWATTRTPTTDATLKKELYASPIHRRTMCLANQRGIIAATTRALSQRQSAQLQQCSQQ